MRPFVQIMLLGLLALLAACGGGGGGAEAPAPVVSISISDVSPRSAAPGASLAVTGSGLSRVTLVRLGGVDASFSIVSDGSLSVTVPAAASTGKLQLSGSNSSGGGASTSTTFDITVEAPTVSGISPASVVPGQTITLSGSFLDQVGSVFLGTVELPILAQSASQLRLSVPVEAQSGAPVLVGKNGLQRASSFSVVILTPLAVSSLSPAAGVAGSSVTLTGAGLDRVNQVFFAGLASTPSSRQTSQLVVAVPSGAALGSTSLRLVASDSELTTTQTFRVAPQISVTSLSPQFGLPGTVVTVSGSGLSEVSSLTLNGVAQSIAAGRSDNQLSFTVPAGATSGEVLLNSASQTSVSAGSYAVSATPLVNVQRIDFVQTYSQQAGDQYQRLVPGKPALVRAYVLGAAGSSTSSPGVTLVVRQGSTVLASLPMTGPSILPTSQSAYALGQTFNATLTASQVLSGLNVTVSVAPSAGGSSLDATPLLGAATNLKLTLVPVKTGSVTAAAPTTAAVRSELRRTLPFADTALDIQLRSAAYTTSAVSAPPVSSDDWSAVLSDVNMLRLNEGNGRHYFGFVPNAASSTQAGLAYLNGPGTVRTDTGIGLDTSYSDWESTFIHEMGHNFSREHAPACGAGEPDANYPYADGALGTVPLYDINNVYGANYSGTGAPGSIVSPAGRNDIMGYCSNSTWFSDYNYYGAQDYLQANTYARLINQASETDLLVIAGSMDADSVRFATPQAQRGLPRYSAGGSHMLRLTLADGTVREQPVRVGRVADGKPGLLHFNLAIPYPGPLAKLEMLKDGRLLSQPASVAAKQIGASGSAPTVDWREQDGVLQLSWNANAFPRLSLTHVGSERRVLATGLSGGSAKVSLADVPAGGRFEFSLAHALDARVLQAKR